MPKLRLSFISGFNERVDPLMKGIVEAEGIELVPTYSHPSETFWRQLKSQEFEVGEMSMSSYLIARERGFDMIALPVFPSRRLFHTEISYHLDSGIEKPEDLVGKRMGVGEYQQTAALWQRGILERDFGVQLRERANACQQRPRLGRVFLHLRHERVEAVEFELRAQETEERHLAGLAIKIV